MNQYVWAILYAAMFASCMAFGRIGAAGSAIGALIVWLVIA